MGFSDARLRFACWSQSRACGIETINPQKNITFYGILLSEDHRDFRYSFSKVFAQSQKDFYCSFFVTKVSRLCGRVFLLGTTINPATKAVLISATPYHLPLRPASSQDWHWDNFFYPFSVVSSSLGLIIYKTSLQSHKRERRLLIITIHHGDLRILLRRIRRPKRLLQPTLHLHRNSFQTLLQESVQIIR